MLVHYALRKSKLVFSCKQIFKCIYPTILMKVDQSTKVKMDAISLNYVRTNFTSAAGGLQENPIVTVAQGKLRGVKGKLHDGSTYCSFKGIPYAQPPVGKLRFKAPLPPLPWTGIHDATEHGPSCPQMQMMFNTYLEGNESCLFLNVYTGSLPPGAKKPVMVFIHGGAYMTGSGNSDMLGPNYLLQHDVILVTVNYRLEVLGFLCLDTEEVPGNAGMKDQAAALKWVKENIEVFGGDANNITLFGESAGATAVTLHMVSPMSKGLFNKAIAQSGVFTNSWALSVDGKERAFRAAKVLGKDAKDTSELLEFLQSVPPKDLIHMTFKTMTPDERLRGLPIYFSPVVEKKFRNVNAFIDEDPVDLLLQNKICDVPLILGYTSAEGMMMAPNTLKKLDFLNKNMNYKVMKEIARRIPESKQKEFGDRIKKFYFGDADMTKEDITQIIALDSDLHFKYGIHLFLNLFKTVNKSPAYLYKFCIDSDMNFVKNAMGYSNFKGASHADDLFYIFSSGVTDDVYKEQEDVRQMVNTVSKLWTDFAKTGNPTPDTKLWTPYTPKTKEYLTIDKTLSIDKGADLEAVSFWNKLHSESGLPSITKSNL